MVTQKPEQPAVAVGQIWREVDQRFDRFVRIEGIRSSRSIDIRTVFKKDGAWISAMRSRASVAHPDRFNGKRSGYELHEAAPQTGRVELCEPPNTESSPNTVPGAPGEAGRG